MVQFIYFSHKLTGDSKNWGTNIGIKIVIWKSQCLPAFPGDDEDAVEGIPDEDLPSSDHLQTAFPSSINVFAERSFIQENVSKQMDENEWRIESQRFIRKPIWYQLSRESSLLHRLHSTVSHLLLWLHHSSHSRLHLLPHWITSLEWLLLRLLQIRWLSNKRSLD